MKEESPLQMILIGAFVFLLLILGAEYYVMLKFFNLEILSDPETYRMENKAIKYAQKLGKFAHLLVLLFLPLFFILLDIKDTKGRRPNYPKPSLPVAMVSIFVFLLTWRYLMKVYKMPLQKYLILFPLEVVVLIVCSVFIGFRFKVFFPDKYGIKNDKIKRVTPISINMPISNNLIKGWVNITSINQGAVIFGAAGSGKTKSFVLPIAEGCLKNGFTGIIYDLKFNHIKEAVPEKRGDITGYIMQYFRQYNITDRKLYIVNFKYPEISHRINVVHPDYMQSMAHARDRANVFMLNLNPGAGKSQGADSFFNISGVGVFQAVLWFLKQNAPQYCTIPHAISLINSNSKELVNMLIQDRDCAELITSLEQAMDEKASDQVAAVVGTAQVYITALINPEVFWTLTGNDVPMDLNHPDSAGVLCIGNDVQNQEVYAPCISLVSHVISKALNQPGRKHSLLLFDEFTTLTLPDIANFANQGRENGCSLVISTQDISLIIDRYGKDKTNVILASLSNEAYGIINDSGTAKRVEEKFGKEEVKIKRVAMSTGGKGGPSRNVSYDTKEKPRVTISDMLAFRKGEFVGKVADSPEPFFKGRIVIPADKGYDKRRDIPDFAQGDIKKLAKENFIKVKDEAAELLRKYNS